MNKLIVVLLSIAILCSCSKEKKIDFSGSFEVGKPLAELKDKRLEESSGLAASINNSGYFWTLNDSGNPAEVYLIDENANIKLTCTLKGISNRDWEEIAVGPGPDDGKNYIYVADIGDNNAIYPFKYIYRFEEPKLTSEQKLEITNIDTIAFKLSDTQKDTEAMLLDPKTKDIYIISKREEPVYVYQLKYPQSTSEVITASSLFSIPVSQITAGCISSDGSEIILKNYDDIFYWKVKSEERIIDALKREPEILAYKPEPQGEAIAWSRDRKGFYTTSETIKNEKSYLSFFKRK